MEFHGNQPKGTRELTEWLARSPAAEALEPELPIVDPHHHLFGSAEEPLFYRRDDLQQDLDGGHRILGTVYVEAYDSGWRQTGPEPLRPVGETDMIVGHTRKPLATAYGPCQVAAGIVCHADLMLGDRVADVLQAHADAAQGRLRGVRYRTATVGGTIERYMRGQRKPHLMAQPDFRRGFAQLDAFGLSFDAWVYHPQIAELLDLVDAFPSTTIVVNHAAGPIGVAEFRIRRVEVLQEWKRGVAALAARPNVRMKVGGMGMPLYGHGFERRERPAGGDELARAWRPTIETCVEAFGTERCMFESNFPVDKQSCRYVDLWNAFKLSTEKWTEGERRHLFYRTACRAYRLPELERQGDACVLART